MKKTDPWKLVFDERAADDLVDLDPAIRRRIRKKLEWLANRLEQVKLEPLRADLSGFSKQRVSDWRVVFRPDEKGRRLVVVAIAHRRHVYKIATSRLT